MPLRFGASYYHEYMPYERLEEDIRLMVAAGFNTVRVGESTWALWEPRDGEFEFQWIQRVVDRMHEAGIEVILGTPTYAIPPWLARTHPQVMAEYATGYATPYGGRQNANLLDPVYRRYAERVIREAVGHFAAHPAVVGFQVDNEAGMMNLHGATVFAAFVDYVRWIYGDVGTLNKAWGLTYWSHNLSSWDDLWRPDGNTNPGYAMAWRRFQAKVVTEFLAWQVGIVRELARSDQFVTHDFVGGHGVFAQDRHATGKVLDFPSDNPYYGTQDALILPQQETADLYAPEWMPGTGVWDIFGKADIARACSANYLVTETSAMSIWGAHMNHPPYPGQLSLAAHALIARGATGVMYWHWHTNHTGNETYWQGVLNHDLEPGRIYEEVAELGATLASYGSRLDGLRPDAPVAVIYSIDSRYASEFQAPLRQSGSNLPDGWSYVRLVNHYMRACFDSRLPVAVLHPQDDWESRPLVVAPAMYIADAELMERLVAYVDGGGHLVITFRTGAADEHNRVRWTRVPDALRPAAGVSLQEYSHLVEPVPLRGRSALAGRLSPGAIAGDWADGLQLEGAEVLAEYEHPFHSRFPAITTNRRGKGRVTYVGTVPDIASTASVLRWAADEAGISAAWPDIPATVRVDAGTNPSGERIWFLGNWSWEAARVPLPIPLVSIEGEPVGDVLELRQFEVRALLERG